MEGSRLRPSDDDPTAVLQEQNYPVVFGCVAGKDRTGLPQGPHIRTVIQSCVHED